MSATRLFVFSLVSLLSLAPLAVSQEIAKPAMQKVEGAIDWVYDYEKGKLLSDESGKPMFVVFRCER